VGAAPQAPPPRHAPPPQAAAAEGDGAAAAAPPAPPLSKKQRQMQRADDDKADKDTKAAADNNTAATLAAGAEAPGGRPSSAGAAASAAAAASLEARRPGARQEAVRQRPAIQWQPQKPQPGDKPLLDLGQKPGKVVAARADAAKSPPAKPTGGAAPPSPLPPPPAAKQQHDKQEAPQHETPKEKARPAAAPQHRAAAMHATVTVPGPGAATNANAKTNSNTNSKHPQPATGAAASKQAAAAKLAAGGPAARNQAPQPPASPPSKPAPSKPAPSKPTKGGQQQQQQYLHHHQQQQHQQNQQQRQQPPPRPPSTAAAAPPALVFPHTATPRAPPAPPAPAPAPAPAPEEPLDEEVQVLDLGPSMRRTRAFWCANPNHTCPTPAASAREGGALLGAATQRATWVRSWYSAVAGPPHEGLPLEALGAFTLVSSHAGPAGAPKKRRGGLGAQFDALHVEPPPQEDDPDPGAAKLSSAIERVSPCAADPRRVAYETTLTPRLGVTFAYYPDAAPPAPAPATLPPVTIRGSGGGGRGAAQYDAAQPMDITVNNYGGGGLEALPSVRVAGAPQPNKRGRDDDGGADQQQRQGQRQRQRQRAQDPEPVYDLPQTDYGSDDDDDNDYDHEPPHQPNRSHHAAPARAPAPPPPPAAPQPAPRRGGAGGLGARRAGANDAGADRESPEYAQFWDPSWRYELALAQLLEHEGDMSVGALERRLPMSRGPRRGPSLHTFLTARPHLFVVEVTPAPGGGGGGGGGPVAGARRRAAPLLEWARDVLSVLAEEPALRAPVTRVLKLAPFPRDAPQEEAAACAADPVGYLRARLGHVIWVSNAGIYQRARPNHASP
jgi:hypothetical protein